MIRILIVEDEQPIANLIDWNLTDCGYSCRKAYDGLTAADLILENTYDLILLDIMLPGVDGYSLLEQIKPTGTPVHFSHGQGIGGRPGAWTPGRRRRLPGQAVEIVELLARVETVAAPGGEGAGERLQIGDVVIDESSMQVTKGGEPVSLTKKEFDLLLLFVRNQNMALFRETIYERVWEAEYTGDSRTVDLHVQRLRKKLGWQHRLTAVYKVGYRLEVKE